MESPRWSLTRSTSYFHWEFNTSKEKSRFWLPAVKSVTRGSSVDPYTRHACMKKKSMNSSNLYNRKYIPLYIGVETIMMINTRITNK